MVLGVKDTVVDPVQLVTILVCDRLEHAYDGVHVFAVLDGLDSFNIFKDENFGALNFDVLVDMEKYCATTGFIGESLLFPSRRKWLAWKACNIEIDFWHA